MFERSVSYPTAVTSDDDEGVDAAIDWCRERLEEQDTLSVWTSRKADLANCSQLERLVSAHSNVEHVTGRGGTVIRTGPVLMAWPDMEDIGELLRSGGPRIRALCVVTWHDDAIRPWVSAVEPELLGDSTAWQQLTPSLDPVVAEAMKSLTRTVNHNNTISGGFEKDMVVGTLLALRDAGVRLDGEAMQGWALANGWSGKNPQRLAKYAQDINAGKRPRTRSVPPADYVELLRRRVEAGE